MNEISLPKWFKPFFQHYRYKGLYGGRGSGKSHCFATLGVLRASAEPGFRMMCVREIQRSIADSSKQLIEDKIELAGLGGFFKITDTEIVGKNGSRIFFRGMQNHTAQSVKSIEGVDVAWIEEARNIKARSLELLVPTVRNEGSEIWASWNPEFDDDPIEVLMRHHPHPDILVREVNWTDNPLFPEALKGDLLRDKERDPDKYNHIWLGQYRTISETRVFKNWRVGEMEVPTNAVWFYGADWGFANDPTAGVRCCFPKPNTLYIADEVFELHTPMEVLPRLLGGLPNACDWPIRADSARPETIDYVKRHGFPKIRPARKGSGSIEDGVTFLQGLDIVVSDKCPNMQRELKTYAYKTDARTGQLLPVIDDKDNHLIDALRYALEGVDRRDKIIAPRIDDPMLQLQRPPDYGESRDDSESWKTL